MSAPEGILPAFEFIYTEPPFTDPTLWDDRKHPLFFLSNRLDVEDYGGLQCRHMGSEPIEHYISDRSKGWAIPLYGSRIAPESTRIETARATTIPLIHDYLARTALAGEHIRPAVFVDAAVGEKVEQTTNLWLDTIRQGGAPIMAESGSGEDIQYSPHDLEDLHPVGFGLQPHELQGRYTIISELELARRQTDSGFMRHCLRNGVRCIDMATDSKAFYVLMEYALCGQKGGDSPSERIQTAYEYYRTDSFPSSWPPKVEAATREFNDDIGRIEEYIVFQQEERLATVDQKRLAFRDVLQGVARVGEKLLGTYVAGQDISLPA